MKFLVPTAIVLWLFSCATVEATPFYYTEQATGNGSLGSNTFTDTLVTITFFGDTTNVTGDFLAGDYLNTVGSAMVTVAGLGTATFTDLVIAFDVQSVSEAGIYDGTVSNEILDTLNSTFNTYNLTTAIGPISGTANVPVPTLSFATNMGAFAWTSIGTTSTFTAGPVPEPLTSGLTLGGLAIIATCARRNRRGPHKPRRNTSLASPAVVTTNFRFPAYISKSGARCGLWRWRVPGSEREAGQGTTEGYSGLGLGAPKTGRLHSRRVQRQLGGRPARTKPGLCSRSEEMTLRPGWERWRITLPG
jgi:hypothetical protein